MESSCRSLGMSASCQRSSASGLNSATGGSPGLVCTVACLLCGDLGVITMAGGLSVWHDVHRCWSSVIEVGLNCSAEGEEACEQSKVTQDCWFMWKGITTFWTVNDVQRDQFRSFRGNHTRKDRDFYMLWNLKLKLRQRLHRKGRSLPVSEKLVDRLRDKEITEVPTGFDPAAVREKSQEIYSVKSSEKVGGGKGGSHLGAA